MNANYGRPEPGVIEINGLKINGVANKLDYSSLQIAAVNEQALNEVDGFAGSGSTTETVLKKYGVYIHKKGWIDNGTDGASAKLDFNDNGSIQTGLLNPATNNTDLNGDTDEGDIFPASRNDWAHIVFDGGQIGEGFEALSDPPLMECHF
jgi:hypothetical protein